MTTLPAQKKRERFLAALSGEAVDRPPVWLMRQAGRYLPTYQEVRRAHGFWEVCKTPELSTKVALEPLHRFKLDAAIVFSDILVIPDALGLGVQFDRGKGEGPAIEKVLRDDADLKDWPSPAALVEKLQYLPNAVSHLSAALKGEYGIIGFAGAPFTLFAYMAQGGGSDDFEKARVLLHDKPAFAKRALLGLADYVAALLDAECAAGCDVVQLFDTWGGLLTREEYVEFCVPALRRIIDQMHTKGRKVLLFAKGATHLLPVLSQTGADGFSLDWRMDWAEARKLFPTQILQGNIDPTVLFSSPETVRKHTQRLLETMRATSDGRSCIVNLGHGILPGTPLPSVEALVNTVVEFAR